MKLIYPQRITSVTADYENSSYPASNVLDNHTSRVWKSAGSTPWRGTLTCAVAGIPSGYGSVAIFNTNAIRIGMQVTQISNGMASLIKDWQYSNYGTSYLGFVRGQTQKFYDIWMDYDSTYIRANHTITISLDAGAGAGVVAQCGVVRAGDMNEFDNPQYGLNENYNDYSVIKQLNNGGIYFRKRGIAKKYSGTLIVNRNNDFYRFVNNIARPKGQTPMAWQLVDDDNYFNIYGGFEGGMPSGTHDLFSHSSISFSIVEHI